MVQTSAEQGRPVTPQQSGMPAVAGGLRPAARLALEQVVRAVAPMTPLLSEAMQQFWAVPVKVSLVSVSQKPHYFWKMDDYHVSQLTLGGPAADHPAQEPACLLRLSDGVCAAFLARALGERNAQRHFSFKQLSPLETTILNEFSRELLAIFKKDIVRKPPPRARIAEPVHLVWAVQVAHKADGTDAPAADPKGVADAFPLGKIVLSLPLNAVRIESEPVDSPEEERPDRVPDAFFFHAPGLVRLHLGGTRLALADLSQLEPGDLIVLEDSHSEQMALRAPDTGEHFEFPVTLRQRQRLTTPMMLPPLQEPGTMNTQPQSRQSLWDNLMIDVTAEFEPVKMPLKQIRQMTEGLVVEMGDIVHNRIGLQVDGKALAWGELLIVGDKFAVRISEVVPEGESAAGLPDAGQAMAALPEMLSAPATAEEQPVAADDAENLDNFLNDDFDEFDDFGDDEYDEEEA